MNIAKTFPLRTAFHGARILSSGALALLVVLILIPGGERFDNEAFETPRDLPAGWVDGYFESKVFSIFWPTAYGFSLELPDTSIQTEDQPIDSNGPNWVKRCGQPFPDGVNWSVRHFGRVIQQGHDPIQLWCEYPSRGHTLVQGIGAFRGWPSPGWTIRIEAPRRTPLSASDMRPFRLWLRTSAQEAWTFAIPAALIVAVIALVAVICIPLGLVLLLMEHFESRRRRRLQRQSGAQNPL
jgi:hypothetical protein